MAWASIVAWSFLCSSIIWGFFKYIGHLRLDLKTEIVGYDFIEFADHLNFEGKRLEVRPPTGHVKVAQNEPSANKV